MPFTHTLRIHCFHSDHFLSTTHMQTIDITINIYGSMHKLQVYNSLCFSLTGFGMCSMGIESVVHENNEKESGGIRDAMCSTCEMAVVWMQNQLKQNETQDHILNYVNEVR